MLFLSIQYNLLSLKKINYLYLRTLKQTSLKIKLDLFFAENTLKFSVNE